MIALTLYSLILGYLTAKIFAGPHEHSSGPFGVGFIIPFHKIKIHIHHWITGFFFMTLYVLVKVTLFESDLSEIDFAIIYFLLGIIAQGIIDYRDWRELVVK
jgi:hypothetical protein